MIRVVVASRVAPMEILNVPISVNVIRRALMPIVTNPALVPIRTGTPAHQSRLAHPGIVIVLIGALHFRSDHGVSFRSTERVRALDGV